MGATIILPGMGGSGQAHWQTVWEISDPSLTRFRPRSWDQPDLDDWMAALDHAVAETAEPPMLVAHSLACLLVAHWAALGGRQRVRGAFLVAVPDPDSPSFPAAEVASFRKVPDILLPFPALVVASSNDPYASLAHAQRRAASWGAGFVAAGALGHINGASALGNWPFGAALLEAFRAGSAHR